VDHLVGWNSAKRGPPDTLHHQTRYFYQEPTGQSGFIRYRNRAGMFSANGYIPKNGFASSITCATDGRAIKRS
jgi:hypothetical protein